MAFLTSTAGSLTIFAIGLAIFIVLCFTKVPRIFAVLLAACVLALGVDAEWTISMFTTLFSGITAVIGSYLPTTISGAAVGTAMAATGCANRIARTITKAIGPKHGALAIMLVSFLVCCSGALGHMWVVLPVALVICRESNIPRGVAMLAYLTQVQIVQFSLTAIPGLPNLMPAEFLGCTIYEEPVMSIVGCLIAEVMVYFVCQGFVHMERKKGNGFEEVPEIDIYKAPDPRTEEEMPSFIFSLLPIVFMIGGSILLNQVVGLGNTPSAIIPQVFTTAFLLITCKKYWQQTIPSENRMEEIFKSMERTFPMIITTGFIGGMGTLIAAMAWYEPGIEWAFSLNASPYLLAFIVVAIICFITSDGISGMQMFLSTLTDKFLAIPGINVGALHRVIVSTACTVESMPWTAGCYQYCSYFGISVKKGWKYHFFGTVLTTTFLALFFVVWSSIAWPC